MTLQEEKKAKAFAKQLVTHSLLNGKVSLGKVQDILKRLQQNPPRQVKSILGYYLRFLKNHIKDSTMLLEYCGELKPEAIQSIATKMTHFYGHGLDINVKANSNLIAGVRISIGNDIWDSSVASNLTALANQLA